MCKIRKCENNSSEGQRRVRGDTLWDPCLVWEVINNQFTTNSYKPGTQIKLPRITTRAEMCNTS